MSPLQPGDVVATSEDIADAARFTLRDAVATVQTINHDRARFIEWASKEIADLEDEADGDLPDASHLTIALGILGAVPIVECYALEDDLFMQEMGVLLEAVKTLLAHLRREADLRAGRHLTVIK